MEKQSRCSRWRIFFAERFPLASHLPMIAGFCLANAAWGLPSDSEALEANFSFYLRVLGIFIFTFSFFLRLRLFDELKDLETDKRVNPDRPLARGLISTSEVKVTLAGLTFVELALVWALSSSAVPVYLLALLYSLLMYKEFFIGPLIRPRLTTYAVMHTFVSVLMGLVIMTSFADLDVNELDPGSLRIVWANWAFFNLFEFARKTFARDEEKDADSYSSLFGTWGAYLLSLSQVCLGSFILLNAKLPTFSELEEKAFFLFALIPMLSGLAYAVKKQKVQARNFRHLSGLYLVFIYFVAGLAAISHQ